MVVQKKISYCQNAAPVPWEIVSLAPTAARAVDPSFVRLTIRCENRLNPVKKYFINKNQLTLKKKGNFEHFNILDTKV